MHYHRLHVSYIEPIIKNVYIKEKKTTAYNFKGKREKKLMYIFPTL